MRCKPARLTVVFGFGFLCLSVPRLFACKFYSWVSLVVLAVALAVSMEGLVSCRGKIGCSKKGFVF